jgi:hypothetical protein
MPSLIDIPLLAPYPAFSILDWQNIAPVPKTGSLVSRRSTQPSLKTVVGTPDNKSIMAADKDFGSLHELELSSIYQMQKDVSPVPSGLNQELTNGSFPVGSLQSLLPIAQLALVRIRATDLIWGTTRDTGPFGSLQQSWIQDNRQTRRIGSTRLNISPGPWISSNSSPGSVMNALGQAENRSGFVRAGRHVESRNEITPIPVGSTLQRSKSDIFESIADDLSISNLMSVQPTLEERAEISASRSFLKKADLDIRSPEMTDKNDLDLAELRTIRRSVHTIMNEQLRKYGFEP